MINPQSSVSVFLLYTLSLKSLCIMVSVTIYKLVTPKFISNTNIPDFKALCSGKDVVMGRNHRVPGSGDLERMCLQEENEKFWGGDGTILYHDSVVIMQIYICVIILKFLL